MTLTSAIWIRRINERQEAAGVEELLSQMLDLYRFYRVGQPPLGSAYLPHGCSYAATVEAWKWNQRIQTTRLPFEKLDLHFSHHHLHSLRDKSPKDAKHNAKIS